LEDDEEDEDEDLEIFSEETSEYTKPIIPSLQSSINDKTEVAGLDLMAPTESLHPSTQSESSVGSVTPEMTPPMSTSAFLPYASSVPQPRVDIQSSQPAVPIVSSSDAITAAPPVDETTTEPRKSGDLTATPESVPTSQPQLNLTEEYVDPNKTVSAEPDEQNASTSFADSVSSITTNQTDEISTEKPDLTTVNVTDGSSDSREAAVLDDAKRAEAEYPSLAANTTDPAGHSTDIPAPTDATTAAATNETVPDGSFSPQDQPKEEKPQEEKPKEEKLEEEKIAPPTPSVPNFYRPTFGTPQAPSAPVGQVPAASVGQAPAAPLGQAPPAQLDQAPVGQAPAAPLGQAPPAQLDQAPAAQLDQAPGAPVGQAPDAQLGQAPGAPVGQVPATPPPDSAPSPPYVVPLDQVPPLPPTGPPPSEQPLQDLPYGTSPEYGAYPYYVTQPSDPPSQPLDQPPTAPPPTDQNLAQSSEAPVPSPPAPNLYDTISPKPMENTLPSTTEVVDEATTEAYEFTTSQPMIPEDPYKDLAEPEDVESSWWSTLSALWSSPEETIPEVPPNVVEQSDTYTSSEASQPLKEVDQPEQHSPSAGHFSPPQNGKKKRSSVPFIPRIPNHLGFRLFLL